MSTNEAAADAQAVDSTPDAQAQAEPARENHGAEEQEMTIEDYKSALEKVRREAAKYRTENKELRPLAERAKEAEEAGKSELQKAQERIAALEAEKQASVLAAARAELAAEHGIPGELISGDDAESMAESAAAIAAYVDKRLGESAKPSLPVVESVGRSSGGVDRDSQARAILGLK